MRLGISSWTFTWAVGVPGQRPERPLGAPALLDRAAALGVRVLQVCDNLPLHCLPPAEIEAFARRADEREISVEVGTRGIGHDHLRTYLHLAERLRSPILRAVVDTADHRPDADEVVATLREMSPEFEQAGVCLAIENHDRFPARALADIVRRIDSPCVGICLDTANSFGALEGPAVVLEVLGPLAVNLHLKDFSVDRARHNLGFVIEGRPVGQGRLDVPWLLEGLRAYGRDVNAILEQWTPPEDTLAATIHKEEVWAAQSIEYLRRFIKD